MVSKFQVPELEVKAEQSETEVKDKVKKKKKAKKTKVVIEISEENGQVKKAKLDFETDGKLKGHDVACKWLGKEKQKM